MSETVKYLIIGGGVASVSAAQAIRERDKEGRVMLASADRYMPYDHPPLSKGFLTDPSMKDDDPACKYDSFYTNNNIEVRLSTRAKSIDRHKHLVNLEDGSTIAYEKLLLATGATPNTLNGQPNPGNVFCLRTIDDAKAIRQRMNDAKEAVVVGSGFMGMEVTSDLISTGIKTTLVTPAEYPWHSFASPRLGKFMHDYYAGKGVRMVMNEKVASITEGPRVITGNNIDLSSDLTFVAIGVTLNLDLAKSAGIATVEKDGVDVDETLQTSDADIYAAGDIAFFKDITMGRKWHLEHHLNGRWQGAVAGANMAGERKVYDQVPYFFSDFFDLHMILRGDPEGGNLTTVIGSFEDADFIELYHDETGVLHCGIAISRDEKKLDPISDKLEELIRAKAKVDGLSSDTFA